MNFITEYSPLKKKQEHCFDRIIKWQLKESLTKSNKSAPVFSQKSTGKSIFSLLAETIRGLENYGEFSAYGLMRPGRTIAQWPRRANSLQTNTLESFSYRNRTRWKSKLWFIRPTLRRQCCRRLLFLPLRNLPASIRPSRTN